MPQLLSDAVRSADGLAANGGGSLGCAATERVHWLECFTGKERVSEFCETTDPAGNFESNSSSGHKEYQDRLRTIALREEGMEKAEIARALGRSQQFVQTWWRKSPKEVPKPAGVHEYLKADFWRDIEIVRGFGKGLGIYDEIVPTAEWLQPMADGAAFKGGYRLKYDKEGRMRPQGNQHAKDGLVPGRYSNLDRLTQRLLSEQGIDDRVLKRPGILWYPDGTADAIEHRHEAWTALMSFGAPRILTIDKQPVLLRDGDLIIFGTQRHGVPRMHCEGSTFDDYGGRISVVFFFMPSGQQAKGSEPWKAIMDTEAPSKKFAAMARDAHLGAPAAMQGLQTGCKREDIQQLVDLGFPAEEAAAALKATGFELERAAEVLLGGGGPALMMGWCSEGPEAALGCMGVHASHEQQLAALCERLAELHRRRQAAAAAPAPSAVPESDEDLARRLQLQEGGGAFSEHGTGDDTSWEEAALLEQIQELQMGERAMDTGAIQTQFAAYEEMLDAQDAEEWDGRGDLMVREWRRAHLHIEQQESATLYAFGCGRLREQDFFELLSLHSIRVLYDFRANPDAAAARHFSVRGLEVACKARGLLYRHIPLGRETAYGIVKHLKEDEGRNSLAEIVWHARRKRAGILGADEDWRNDHRLAIAARLTQAGHRVLHVLSDGSTEEHPKEVAIPDHIASEEQRLRTLEKQRLAGELKRPQKSAVSRSTESVAQRLTAPQKVIDAGEILRAANTQAELCRAQRRLADLQRRSDDNPDAKAGLGPKLTNVNKWVRAESAQQRENLAKGLTKDGKEKGGAKDGGGAIPSYSWVGSGGTSGGNPDFASTAPLASHTSSSSTALGAEAEAAEPPFLVECMGCNDLLPWEALAPGDGCCPRCALAACDDASAACIAALTPAPAGEPGTAGCSAAGAAIAGGGLCETADRVGRLAAETPGGAAKGRCSYAAGDPSCASDAAGDGAKTSWRARRRQQQRAGIGVGA